MEHEVPAPGEDARFERNPDFIFRRIVDEAVLVPVHQPVTMMDCICTLNEVAASVWERLDAPATQGELQKAVLDEFAAPEEELEADLAAFLRRMVEIDAIRTNGPVPPAG
jgi:hypothetical protein